MFTQCPDCSTAFRVTAEVLKQAAGKVRCGGCGNAFNALAYLSETMPEQPTPREENEHLPELTPEPLKGSAGAPASISAEQSAALLKTLDELAGSDIRIEDTGVEWRVMDEDEIGEAADDDVAVDLPVKDQPDVDELLEDSPTPVDQFLTSTPPEVDSPEIFEEEVSEPAKIPVDELRFDDNTPLPDDFDLDDIPPATPAEPPAVDVDEEVVEDEPQAEIDLSEPDEWTDILDEFEGLGEAVSEQTIADELAALADEAFDAGDAADEPSDEPVDEAVDEAVDVPAEAPESAVAEPTGEEPLDMDTQFALQAEAMGIDLSGVNETLELAEESDVDLDALLDESRVGKPDIEGLLEEESVDDATVSDLDFEEYEAEDEERDADEESEPEQSGQLELIDEADELEGDETEEDEAEEDDTEEDDTRAVPADAHFVPPMTEEEETINMQIDQDLLAIAVTDEDGFASTIVIPEANAETMALEDRDNLVVDADDENVDDESEQALEDTGTGFETIIMEGEHVRSALDPDNRAKDKEAAAASLAGAAAENEERAAEGGDRRRYGMIAAAVVLVIVLAIQAVHQSRNSLATIPAFNSVVGPMYRALGKPLLPEWDITGWRFEVTRGSTDENDENLTIYSRLGNKSDTPLPYPLIGISLTDRFEETIGSRILDPAEYLADDLDPRELVDPGNTFNAVITIPSPAEEATGFKLNVCYRESGGNLRCAIDDFK